MELEDAIKNIDEAIDDGFLQFCYSLNALQILVDFAKSMQWQPIETLPQRELVLMRCAGSDVPFVGSFFCGNFFENYEHIAIVGEGVEVSTKVEATPTHWMPLPQPPKE